MYYQSLIYYLFNFYKFIFIFFISLGTVSFSKVLALPPIIDLYNDPYGQSTASSEYASTSYRTTRTLKIEKTPTAQYTIDELKEQIQHLESVVRNSQEKLAAQEKITRQLQGQLLQVSPKASAILPNLTKNHSLQNSTSLAKPIESKIVSEPLADWQALKLLLKSNAYQASEVALKNFIRYHPKDFRVADAHYLLGQVALIQGKPDQALSEFNTMTRYYPKSKYIPYAHYHRALAYYAKGDHTMAESLFKKLEQSYPSSEAARKASHQREKLGLI